MFPEQNPDPILRIQLDGTLLYANGSSRTLLEEWRVEVGQTVPSEVRVAAQRSIDTGQVQELDVICGTDIFGLRFAPIPAGPYVNIYGRNVTTERAAHAEVERLNRDLEHRVRRRTEELETINGELESFTYSVSHDLRAPVRSLHGFSAALVEDYGDRLDARAHDFLRRIQAAARRMESLIDDLLQLSRITKTKMDLTTVDLGAMARDIAGRLRETAPSRTVTFVIPDRIVVRGNAPLLRVVMDNLLRNAWKFTGPREDARIEFGCQEEDGRPVFFVRDNGVGFDMTYAEGLFGVFQRLHSVDEFPGTGVGLATVHRAVARHHGRIWAEAEVGRGATFFFTIQPEVPS